MKKDRCTDLAQHRMVRLDLLDTKPLESAELIVGLRGPTKNRCGAAGEGYPWR